MQKSTSSTTKPDRMSAKDYLATIASGVKGKSLLSPKKQNRPEEDLHRDCIQWADNPIIRIKYSDLEFLFHAPNGGGRSKAEAGVMKACGVRSGVPDLMLALPSARYSGLAVELKSPDGRLSENQAKWLTRLRAAGYLALVARTQDDFIRAVEDYFSETDLCAVIVNDRFEISTK